MTDRMPVEVTNLDRYKNAELPWSRPHDLLAVVLPFSVVDNSGPHFLTN